MGLHDDWSYIYTAKRLAETGHVIYNGWATAMLGWQLYLGAFFAKLFGFSFTAVRASVILVSAVTVRLGHAVLVRLGVRPWNAAVGMLTFALSPLYLPLAASYMTDIPSLFCVLLCLYGSIRAVQASTDRSTLGWLAFAALTNVAGGTVRQIAWLGVLVMVPSTAWLLRRRRGVMYFTAAIWLASVLMVMGLLHWFNQQPYASVEKLFALNLTPESIKYLIKTLVKIPLTLNFLLIPIFFGFALRYRGSDASSRRRIAIASGMVILVVGGLSLRHHGSGVRWMTILIGNYLGAKGILDLPWILGITNDIIPRPVQALSALVQYVSTAVCLCMLWDWRKRSSEMRVVREGTTEATASALFWLLGPFLAAYMLLIVTRILIFDRYLLPIEFVALVALLITYERNFTKPLPALSLLPILALGAYGVAGTHDLYAATRARLLAANNIRALGIPRSELRAGFEYDGWTQIDMSGYVNEPRIHNPAGAYHPWTPPKDLPTECVNWYRRYTPSVHARYELSNQPAVCFPDAHIPPVLYSTWLPPYQRAIYFVEVPEAAR